MKYINLCIFTSLCCIVASFAHQHADKNSGDCDSPEDDHVSLIHLKTGLPTRAISRGSVHVPKTNIAPHVSMPMLAMGSALIPAGMRECSVHTAVEQWLRLGGRHIDTSVTNYGDAQKQIGAAIKASGVRRQDIFITTKVEGPIGKQKAIDSIKNIALRELGTDYIDLVLIHTPCPQFFGVLGPCYHGEASERASTWEGLMELKKQGIIRAAGVSNYDRAQLAEFSDKDPDQFPAVNQVQWHLGYHDEQLLQTMQALNITMMAWGALDGITPGIWGSPGVALGDHRLAKVAAKYGISTAQLELRWEVQRGVVPVTSTCNEDHAFQDLSAFTGILREKDMVYLNSLTS